MKLPMKKLLQYIGIILAGFVILFLAAQVMLNLGAVLDAVSSIAGALRAIVLGCVMAYLLYPVAKFAEHFLLYQQVSTRGARALSTGFATLVLLTLIFMFIYFIVPELAANLPALVQDLPWMIRSTFNQLANFLEAQGQSADILQDISTKLTNTFTTWLQGDALDTLTDLLTRVVDLAKGLLNFVIGIIVMVYLLMSRDQFVGQAKKLLFAMCKNRKTCDTILKHVRVINRIFGGFVSGKLLDSLIIGILCWISLSILNMPYTMIISLIVGITNIIPVFGPFFGAIPSAFLLLLTDPGKCLVFIIFIIILQQIDGNIIGPKILGDSTGLPAFWVLFSLLLFNHLMGFWGMLLGVPLFASFYYLLREFINARLSKKDLSMVTEDYINVSGIDEDGTLHYTEPKRIQFYPLVKGDDSYLSQLKAWLERPIPKDALKNNKFITLHKSVRDYKSPEDQTEESEDP
ncbi:MAG: AI-2E family transporter [Ruminiclostridium sp.]|nr:AI-2E family transporter [Ruminiclostridium sp.]